MRFYKVTKDGPDGTYLSALIEHKAWQQTYAVGKKVKPAHPVFVFGSLKAAIAFAAPLNAGRVWVVKARGTRPAPAFVPWPNGWHADVVLFWKGLEPSDSVATPKGSYLADSVELVRQVRWDEDTWKPLPEED